MPDRYNLIAGVDEAGRGCLAGPVVAGAVLFRTGEEVEEADDSKKLSAKRREEILEMIKERAIAYAVGVASVEEINKYNIHGATKIAMLRAVESLSVKPEFLIVDYVKLQTDIPYIAPAKADENYKAVGAASLLAKVHRDNLLIKLAKKYPRYSLEKNKGYGTAAHIEAIKKYGVKEIHREIFVRKVLTEGIEQGELFD